MELKISYAITCCNELEEITRLINFLNTNKREEDEICVLLDRPKASIGLLNQLYRFSSSNWIILKESAFKGNFADWKNELNQMCTKDYIVNIDSDELPNVELLNILPGILEANPEVDLYYVPRINTVSGITDEYLQKMGWNINEKGWVNFPDFQSRCFKNHLPIKWRNAVHEVIEGHKQFTVLPAVEEYSFYHPKTIEKQEKQNNYYNTL